MDTASKVPGAPEWRKVFSYEYLSAETERHSVVRVDWHSEAGPMMFRIGPEKPRVPFHITSADDSLVFVVFEEGHGGYLVSKNDWLRSPQRERGGRHFIAHNKRS